MVGGVVSHDNTASSNGTVNDQNFFAQPNVIMLKLVTVLGCNRLNSSQPALVKKYQDKKYPKISYFRESENLAKTYM